MNMNETNTRALRAILAELGSTPAKARTLVEAGRAAHGGADPPGALATLNELVRASDILGKTAHRVLGHAPDEAAYHSPETDAPAAAAPPEPDADTLLTRLT